jgi:hypothetical protein
MSIAKTCAWYVSCALNRLPKMQAQGFDRGHSGAPLEYLSPENKPSQFDQP